MKPLQIVGIVVALAMIIAGLVYPVPEKHLRVSSSSYAYDNGWEERYGAEYVGGDAYNYQMEASLKAGYMSGILSLKSTAVAAGILLMFISLYSGYHCKLMAERETYYMQAQTAANQTNKLLREILEQQKAACAATPEEPQTPTEN